MENFVYENLLPSGKIKIGEYDLEMFRGHFRTIIQYEYTICYGSGVSNQPFGKN